MPAKLFVRFSLQRKPNRHRMIFWFWTRPNTARQVISTVSAKVFFKGGRPRCSGRFLANLDILRLTTRGLTRLRRGSSALGPFPPAAIDTIGSDPAE